MTLHTRGKGGPQLRKAAILSAAKDPYEERSHQHQADVGADRRGKESLLSRNSLPASKVTPTAAMMLLIKATMLAMAVMSPRKGPISSVAALERLTADMTPRPRMQTYIDASVRSAQQGLKRDKKGPICDTILSA